MRRSHRVRERKILFCLYLFSTFFIPPVAGLRLYLSLSLSLHLFAPSFFNAALLLSFSPFLFPCSALRPCRSPARGPPVPFFSILAAKMWHSTGLLRCLRWCGIRAGLPRRGVHRGNDAQIGRIISKTTTLCLHSPPPTACSSPLISLSPSFSHSASRASFRSLAPVSLAPCSVSVVLARARAIVADGRQGWNTTPTFGTAAEQPPCHRCLPPCPTTSD